MFYCFELEDDLVEVVEPQTLRAMLPFLIFSLLARSGQEAVYTNERYVWTKQKSNNPHLMKWMSNCDKNESDVSFGKRLSSRTPRLSRHKHGDVSSNVILKKIRNFPKAITSFLGRKGNKASSEGSDDVLPTVPVSIQLKQRWYMHAKSIGCCCFFSNHRWNQAVRLKRILVQHRPLSPPSHAARGGETPLLLIIGSSRFRGLQPSRTLLMTFMSQISACHFDTCKQSESRQHGNALFYWFLNFYFCCTKRPDDRSG